MNPLWYAFFPGTPNVALLTQVTGRPPPDRWCGVYNVLVNVKLYEDVFTEIVHGRRRHDKVSVLVALAKAGPALRSPEFFGREVDATQLSHISQSKSSSSLGSEPGAGGRVWRTRTARFVENSTSERRHARHVQRVGPRVSSIHSDDA